MYSNFLFTCFTLTYLQLIASQPSPYGFKVQYIGNSRYVSKNEESERNFCDNIYCTFDAEILFTRASQYKSSDPCVDFKNFSVGTALEVNAVNERYPYRGLISEVEFKYWERLRRILSEKIQKNESRMSKVLKNSFQKCVKSPHVLRHLHGHKEILNYLHNSLGGSPFLTRHIHWNENLFNNEKNFGLFFPKNSSVLENDFWIQENFSIGKILEEEPVDGLWFLLSYELKRCDNGNLCFRFVSTEKFNKSLRENVIKFLEILNDNFIAGLHGKIELKEKMFEPAIKNFEEFSRRKENIEKIYHIEKKLRVKRMAKNKLKTSANPKVDKKIFQQTEASRIKSSNKNIKDDDEIFNKLEANLSSERSKKLLKISELNKYLQISNFTALNLINNQLLRGSKITENDLIEVEDFELFMKLVENLKTSDKRTIADHFSLSYLFLYQFISTFHFDDDFVSQTLGTKKSPQRFETCLIFNIISYLQPVLLLMYQNRFGKEENSLQTQNFIKEIVAEARQKFSMSNNLPLDVAVEIFIKLKNLSVVTSFDEMKENHLEKFYADLYLKGNEQFFESFLAIKKFSQKLDKEKIGSWRRRIENKAGKFKITYDLENENELYIPSMWLMYPWYHPQRPRFFNMATLFAEVLTSFHSTLRKIISKNYNIQSFITGLEDPVQISYEHYKTFLKKNQDLQIGANFLTNLQIFWVARAVYHFSKYHHSVPENLNAIQRLQIEYMHVEFKSKQGFQEAFECNMSEHEWFTYRQYMNKFYDIFQEIQPIGH